MSKGFIVVVILGLLVIAMVSASGQPTPGASPSETVVYVSNFDLDAQNFQPDKGHSHILQQSSILHSRQQAKDPPTEAARLVDLMATSIVSDLRKAGYRAERLPATDVRPATGIWVHGVFTELGEGNRTRRAVLGFGAGAAKMELYATMNDLARPEQPLYTTVESGDSGKQPGAAITLNPYVAAAKFVIEKNAPDKAIKKTAADISADIVAHLKPYEAHASSK